MKQRKTAVGVDTKKKPFGGADQTVIIGLLVLVPDCEIGLEGGGDVRVGAILHHKKQKGELGRSPRKAVNEAPSRELRQRHITWAAHTSAQQLGTWATREQNSNEKTQGQEGGKEKGRSKGVPGPKRGEKNWDIP